MTVIEHELHLAGERLRERDREIEALKIEKARLEVDIAKWQGKTGDARRELRGAVELLREARDHIAADVAALEEILDDLRRPEAPDPGSFGTVAHAIQVAEGALARLGGW